MQSSHEVVEKFYYAMKEPQDYEKAMTAKNAIPHVDPLEFESVTKEQGGVDKFKKKQTEKRQQDTHILRQKVPNRDSGYVSSIYWEPDDHDKTEDTQTVKSTETYKGVLFPHCDFAFNYILKKDNQDRLKLVKCQLYFDFVPPPLNDFEYAMTKLSKIEKSLLRQFPMQESEPSLHRYMSFTLVHGNHLDTKQASLALFDAEPDERKNDQNKSGIVVVYLGKDVTFEMLTDMTRNTGYLEMQGDDKFVAVHSEHLLQDRSKMRNLLRPILGGGLKIIDVNREMDKLFKRFEDLTIQAFTDMRKLITDVKEKHKEDEMLETIEKRFSALYKLHNEDKKKQVWRTPNKIRWRKSVYQRLKDQGLQGYTTEIDTLILFFQRSPSSKEITENSIPMELRKRYSRVKIVQFTGPLYRYHHNVTGGDKLHPSRHNANKYGTVGMFGSICLDDSSIKSCCISSPHVISSGQTAYILNGTVALGNCIWPPPVVPTSPINVEDISVICVESIDIEISRVVERQVTLFHEDRQVLKKRKVYKYGAATSKTIGFIQDSEFVLTIGDPVNVFLIEPEDSDDDSSRFSQPGDSGAIVLTKFGQNVFALSMIFGGDIDLEGVDKNVSIAVDLNEAIQRFNAKNVGQSVHLDTL